MKWRKAKFVNVRGVELNRPMKLIIPFKINETVDSVSTRLRTVAAVNADIKQKLTTAII